MMPHILHNRVGKAARVVLDVPEELVDTLPLPGHEIIAAILVGCKSGLVQNPHAVKEAADLMREGLKDKEKSVGPLASRTTSSNGARALHACRFDVEARARGLILGQVGTKSHLKYEEPFKTRKATFGHENAFKTRRAI